MLISFTIHTVQIEYMYVNLNYHGYNVLLTLLHLTPVLGGRIPWPFFGV
jgi:hypothetical protein